MNVITVKDAAGYKTLRLILIQKTLKSALKKMRIDNVHVDVTLINDAEMKKLNRVYRGKNKPTDVLSFGQKDMKIGKLRVLGDIIIAKETTAKQAKKMNHPINDEYTMLAVHGLLHLLGYDHERKKDELVMFALQRKLLDYARAK
ncbi:MAG: rRNA maturation RNase YbeY [Bdellovibrionota bacterium]